MPPAGKSPITQGKTGFRRNEIKNGQFLHNGQPILIKGVNRHDHNPRHRPLRHHGGHPRRPAADEARQHQRRAHLRTIRTIRPCSNFATNSASMWSPRPTSNPTAWATARSHWPRIPPGSRPTSTASRTWSSATRTTRASSCGRWATRRAMARTSSSAPPGSASAIRPAPSITNRPHTHAHVDLLLADVCHHRRLREILPHRGEKTACETNARSSSANTATRWAIRRAISPITGTLFRKERLLQGGFIWDWKDQAILHMKHTAQRCGGSLAGQAAGPPVRLARRPMKDSTAAARSSKHPTSSI